MIDPRAYGTWDARQQASATLVYDADDVKRVIALHALDGTPCRLLAAAHITMKDGIKVPPSIPWFSFDGDGRFKVFVSGDVDTLFAFEAGAVAVADVQIQLRSGATLATLFSVASSPALFENVRVDASAGALTDVFAVGATTVARCTVDTCVFGNVANLFANDAGATWHFCRFSGVYVDSLAGTVTIGRGAGGPTFSACAFENLDGLAVIDLNASDCLFRGGLGTVFSVTTHNASAQGNVFLSSGTPSSVTLSGVDVWIGAGFGSSNAGSSIMGQLAIGRQVAAARLDVDGGVVARPSSATLNSAGPTLTPGDRSFIKVTHGASASGNVTIAAGVDGQILTLYFVAVAGAAAYTDGSGNLQLSANLTPTSADTLTLIYEATTAKWVEIARSVN